MHDSYESNFYSERIREQINTSFHTKTELSCSWKVENSLDLFMSNLMQRWFHSAEIRQ